MSEFTPGGLFVPKHLVPPPTPEPPQTRAQVGIVMRHWDKTGILIHWRMCKETKMAGEQHRGFECKR